MAEVVSGSLWPGTLYRHLPRKVQLNKLRVSAVIVESRQSNRSKPSGELWAGSPSKVLNWPLVQSILPTFRVLLI